jgi:N-acetylmuramoyl-L-alanine amidase
MGVPARRRVAALLGGVLLLVACSTPNSPSASVSPSASAPVTASPTAGIGDVVPAPGSSSTVYEPNPGAIVVAIDPGHGGCLDWGVPDPLERGTAFSEKTLNLAIATELRHQLQAQGISVVLTREDDDLLAGDDYPDLGCHGAPFRDVNGDGESGFDPVGKTRARDELQARIDKVNVARADLLVSIHINSLYQDGVSFQIAATQTYYTDETAWGNSASELLARLVQDAVVAAIAPLATYDRQDRGIESRNYYVITPPLFTPTAERPDPLTQPTRGVLMPAILTEVGSINLAAEQDLLLSSEGQAAIATGIARAISAYLAERPLAVRYDALVDGGEAGAVPAAVPGSGPPFWIPSVDPATLASGLGVRLTNTGTRAWPAGLHLLVGWEASDQPYLRRAPDGLTPLAVTIPSLAPGESVELRLPFSAPVGAPRTVAWITLATGDAALTDLGSPPLQLADTDPSR